MLSAPKLLGIPRSITDPVIAFALVAIVWEKAVDLFQIKRYLLPPLSQILQTSWNNRDLLLRESMVTAWEVLLGYVWALAGGILLGLAIFAWPVFRRTVYPLVVMFQGLPKIALAPLLVVWFGYGTSSKVLMAFLFAFFPVVISTLGGLAGTPAHLIEHFHAIGASSWTMFRRLRVPSALPAIMDGCKTAMPLAVIGAIAGEFVGSEKGLGNLILLANANAKTDLVFAALLAISILVGGFYLLIELAAKRVWWRAF
ncbi:MAG: ABC transporter permease [Proteobacteria bacterium]|nr:ABC transporter permease [Pseudomonadota bacterium]